MRRRWISTGSTSGTIGTEDHSAFHELMSVQILQANPLASYLAHREEIDDAVRRVLGSGRYILGKETQAFEQEFAAYLGVKHAVGVGSGTDALHLALRACGIGPGDEVITTSHTAVATVAAIELAGATPVLVDIDPKTYTLDVSCLEAALSSRTKAVLPVHLYGHPAAMPAILEIARKHGLRVIEDCAQSHGAAINGIKTGAWGDIAAFSFYPTKNLGAFGDGGTIVTNDSSLREKTRLLREYGWSERYVSSVPGMNSRLDELQSAMLRVKLKHLDQDNQQRQVLAQQYLSMLAGSCLRLPMTAPGAFHSYHLFVVAHQQRNKLKEFLQARGIGCAIHYPVPVHLQPAYSERLRLQPLPNTEKAVRQVLSLPLYPELSPTDASRVTTTILDWIRTQADIH